MAAHRVTLLDSAAALRADIQRHCGDAVEDPRSDAFCTLAWFENLADNGLESDAQHPANGQWLLARDAGSELICLPLQASRNKLTGLGNYYSSLYGPIRWRTALAPAPDTDAEPAVWRVIAQYLRRQKPRWPVLSFSPLDVQSLSFDHLQAGLKHAGYRVDRFFCFGNWYLDVAGRTFASYRDTLPSPLRHSIERGQRRLARAGNWRIDIALAPGPELEAAIADFVRVYSQSWKGPEPNTRFIPSLARMAAAQGWLRLGVLSLDGQAIAAQLWLVKDGKASIYKLAYVKGFEKLSAGSVLTHALMQRVFDVDQVREVDYLSGDDAYKRDWMSHRRERWGIVAFNPATIAGNWAALQHFGGKWLRRTRAAPG